MSSHPPGRIHRYRVLAEIGRGSMGRVYLAEDPNVGRRVALKVLWPQRCFNAAQEEQLKQRFLNEVRAAGRLHHPGIVAVYDAGTDPTSGSPFLAMEWVAGPTLRHRLKTGGNLTPAAAAALGAQVARALDHAHRRGVVHRDVKPTNLLVTGDRRIKLADFGIARLRSSPAATAPGTVLGTPCYMSPEQVRGAPVDGRSDLFTLGAVLYECLAGRRAFGADSPQAVHHRVLAEPLAPLEPLCPELPPELGRAIARALEKRPEDRFQTGAELAAVLERIAVSAGGAVPAPPRRPDEETLRLPAATAPTATGRARAAARNRRRRAATAVLAATILLAIWTRGGEPPANPPTPRTAPAATTGGAGPASGAELPAVPVALPALPRRPPPPAAGSTLEIVHRNRLRLAYLSVWVDGERVLRERLEGKYLARLFGRQLRRRVEVPPGEHAVEVHVSGISRGLEARQSIAGSFADGEPRRLRIRLRRDRGELELQWIGDDALADVTRRRGPGDRDRGEEERISVETYESSPAS